MCIRDSTSTAFRDNWTVGYTSEWVVGVWVGNFDGRPMVNITGVTGAGPIWAEVMDLATQGHAQRPPAPSPLQRATHCALSGELAGPHCTHTIDTQHPAEAKLPQTCDWHAACGVRWPGELRQWARQQGLDTRCDHPSLEARIAFPPHGAVFYIDPRIPADQQQLSLRADVPGDARVSWRVNGKPLPLDGTTAPWTPSRHGPNSVELYVDGERLDRVSVHIGGITPTRADTR